MTETRTLVLWDVDHTLIENGGVSKLNYSLAFELLTGTSPQVPAATDGRTDVEIMENLWRDNDLWESLPTGEEREKALADVGERNRPLLADRGQALPGAHDVLVRMVSMDDVISSVPTGNIPSNARVKLGAVGLDQFVEFEVGASGNERCLRCWRGCPIHGLAGADGTRWSGCSLCRFVRSWPGRGRSLRSPTGPASLPARTGRRSA